MPVRQGRNLSKTFLRPSGEPDPELPFVEGEEISRPLSAGHLLSACAKVQEAGFALAEAIAAGLRTASAPDLAMLVVAGCQLRQAFG